MSINLNSVTLSGNLTRDPELRMAGSAPVLNFSIATNESRKTADGDWEDVPSFFEVQVWGARGEKLHGMLSKGSKVALVGRLKQNRWQADDGTNRSKVIINAYSVELMTRKATGASEGQEDETEDVGNVFSEDIPFF